MSIGPFRLFLLGLTLAGTLGLPAAADPRPVVVELYTSQGCSSCPPADALLQELAGRDDVIALALHVDYWDYIGWKDEFAKKQYSDRQRRYAITAGRRSVYTPQMIVNGQDSIVGARAMDLADAIQTHKAVDSGIRLALQRQGPKLRIRAEADRPLPGKMVVQLVRFQPRGDVKILRGENAGRHLNYSNIVREWTVVEEWNGRRPLDLEVDAPGDLPAVVLIQQSGPGPILAAAQLD